jgi:hypothetical protein
MENDSVDGKAVEKEITFPASVSVTEEDVTERRNIQKEIQPLSTINSDQGEKP